MIRIPLRALTFVAVFAAALIVRADEFDTLRSKWRDMLTQGTNSSFADPLYSGWIASIESSARSYSNSLNTSPGRTYLWSTYSDLATDSSDISGTYTRLRAMALAYAVRGSALEGNTALRANIISGLDWMYTNYYNPTGVVYDNWFDFEIATPLALNDIVVMLYPNLSPAQISNYMSAVEHFAPVPDYTVIPSPVTAANKVWKALVVSLRGVIVRDTNKIDLGRTALSDVFTNVTSGDGFYADGSFIFHNNFPYNAGYGVELIDSMGSMMQLLQGSTWQLTDPAQTNVFRWVYDSYEPFIVRGAAMEMVDGRYHTRDGDGHLRGHELLGAILRVAQIAPPADAAAFKSFVKGAIQADTYRNFVSKELPPYNVWASAVMNDTNVVPLAERTEHRQFPGMDRVVHRTPEWTFGLSMSSKRVGNYESTRGENLKGWFTADGMTYLYNCDLGHYADNFWATVNPARLPGTTVDTITRTNGSGDSYLSPNNQVGGASILGRYGVAVMHLNAWGTDTASARKSWFMFDNEIVCLGNSITSGVSATVETVIENRRLGIYGNNAFTVNGAAKSTGPGWSETMAVANNSWAHLAGSSPGADVGYYFPSATTVKGLRESRSGALYDLNTTYGSQTRSTRHYLTLWFDHGTNPSNGSYSYVLLPNQTATAVAAYAANPDILVLTNNSRVQAVKETKLGITAANFWREGSNYVNGVSSDQKASVIFRNDGSVLDFGISDPTQTNTGVINIELATAATLTLSADPGVSVLQLSPTIKLAVNASNRFGATLQAKFFLGPMLTNNLSPIADAYVQNGPQSVTNFGDATTLAVKQSGSTQARESFLRFDLSAARGTILNSTLRLVPVTTNDVISNAVAFVSDNSWIESGASGITWNNKPSSESEHARWLVPVENTPVFVPITALAQQAVDGDGKLSLRLFSTGTPAPSNTFTAYASRSNGVVNSRPQLSVTFIRTRPTVTLSASSAAADAPATITLTADAQGSVGSVTNVAFYYGPTRIAQLTAPPYTTTAPNLAPGNYTFTAVATDNSGLSATSAPVNFSAHSPEPVGRGTGLNGEYYSDRNLTALVTTRTDANVNFLWGFGPPAPAVPQDNFSVRWIGKLQARHAGLHQFHTVTDEGVRLWIDGRLVIDNWNAHVIAAEDAGSICLVPGRYYDITMEYFDVSFSAVAQLFWTQPGVAKEIIPQSQLYSADQGLRATYFAGTNLTSPVLTRIDDTVNFAWSTNSPDPTALPGAFSARWKGKVRANQGGLYSFFTLSDDAVRLWVNGVSLINNWTPHALTEDSNSITLVAGQFYDMAMEYFNASGVGSAVLSWQPPGEPKQVIPVTNLTPHQNNNPPSLAAVSNLVTSRNALATLAASAADLDAPFQSLIFSLDPGAPAGASIDPSTGIFSWTPSAAQPFGTYSVTLRVTDTGVPEMSDAQTFAVVVQTNLANASVTLVPSGGTWRYLDNGIDQGSGWRAAVFNDSAWNAGSATLGYGIGEESTTISFGGNAANKHITTYFRRTFYVPDASLVESLAARLVRDDGAVVYLNDTEVWRDNMPVGPVAFSTLASSAMSGSGQTQFITRALSPSALVNGTNVIAIEIHQDSANTPDARFDCELTATAFVPPAALNCARSGGNLFFTWPESAGLLRLYSTTNLSPPAVWVPVAAAPALLNGHWTVQFPSGANPNEFFRLQTP